jgi:hypothetical protein
MENISWSHRGSESRAQVNISGGEIALTVPVDLGFKVRPRRPHHRGHHRMPHPRCHAGCSVQLWWRGNLAIASLGHLSGARRVGGDYAEALGCSQPKRNCTGLVQILGQLYGSNRDFQSKCRAKSAIFANLVQFSFKYRCGLRWTQRRPRAGGWRWPWTLQSF